MLFRLHLTDNEEEKDLIRDQSDVCWKNLSDKEKLYLQIISEGLYGLDNTVKEKLLKAINEGDYPLITEPPK